MTRNGNTVSARPTPAWLAVLGFVVLCTFVGWTAFVARIYFVDDAFTGFCYVKNLLAGHGFVFQPGQSPVEGVTNVGWLLAIAPFAMSVGPGVASKFLGAVCLLVALSLTLFFRRGKLQVVPTLLLITSFEFVYFSLAGMETALLATLLLVMAWTAARRPHSIALPMFGALAFLVHPEAAAVYPLYFVISWIVGGDSRRRLLPDGIRRQESPPTLGLVTFVVLIGLATAARLAYFGDLVPNTFHGKPSSLALMIQNGFELLTGKNPSVSFPIVGWLALPVLVLGYFRMRRDGTAADMLAVVAGVGLVMAVYSPADWTVLPRYFAPYLPAALILFWTGLIETASLVVTAGQERTRRLVLFCVAVVLVATNVFNARSTVARMDEFPGYVMAGRNLIGPAGWMRDHLPQGATVATRRIGAAAFFGHRKVFDYSYGLADPQVAHMVAQHGGRFDTPTDPALACLWQQRAPDYLLEDGPIMDYIISQSSGRRERFSIHGIEYRVIREFPLGRDVSWVLAERRGQKEQGSLIPDP